MLRFDKADRSKKPLRTPMKKSPKPRRRPGMPDRVGGREERRPPGFSREVSVLYEDDAVVVLDKPAGLLAVPIKGSKVPSAWSLLSEELKRKKQRAFVVHRIDRFASGLLLFAKTAPDRDTLVRQFLAHTPVRQYLTVLRGHLGKPSGTLVHYFHREGMLQQLRTAKDPQAARAELRYTVERLFAEASFVRVELVTGLQNQIRAQFSALGHPVIGDRKYHPAEASERLIARVALHATHLQFVHPRSGESISIDCKLPPDFRYLVRELSQPSAG
jgi:RluA family pseudouridine synthase